MSLTKATYSMISGAVINVLDEGADSSGLTDSAAAVQSAINKAVVNGGGVVFFPQGEYLINTALNLTSVVGTSRAYVTLQGEGNATVIEANTGGRLFDCVGSNFLMFRDFYVVGTKNNPSTIIFQLARSTGSFNFCHHNRIENVTISIKSIHAANNNFGTIGLLNVEGEDFSTFNFYSSANSPVVLMRQPAAAALLTLTSYAPIASSSVSFGQVTFAGKTLMQAWNRWCPPLHIDGVNTCTFENAHWAGGTSPWDSDTTSTWEYAIRTGATNPIATCQFFGLVESHKKFMFVQANIENIQINALVAAENAIATDPLINLQNYLMVGSVVSMQHGDTARRQFIAGTGQIIDCVLSGYNVTDYLESTLAVNVLNTEHSNDRKILRYGQGTQQTVIATVPINIATPGTIVSYISLPTVTPNNSSGFVSVKLEGVITTYGVKTQAAAPSSARFISYVDLVSNLNGTYTIGTPATTLSTPVSGDAATAAITGLTVTAAVVSNVLQITASGTASGTSAYTNGVNLTGTIALEWRGFSGNEGVVIA